MNLNAATVSSRDSWAKLVPIDLKPESDPSPVHLVEDCYFIKENSVIEAHCKDVHSQEGCSKIFRDQEANYWIQDSLWIPAYKLDVGDKIHGYVFCPISRETNQLKRGREAQQQQQQQALELKKNPLDEISNGMKSEMTCSICLDLIYQCVTVIPCLHDFCASCLSEWVSKSDKCPNCKDEFEKAKRSPSKNNMVESLLTARPDLRRSKEEYEAKDAKDIIKNLLYVVTEDDGSIYRGTMVNGNKEGQGVYEEFDDYIYKGKWKNNEMHGHGKMIFNNGETYVGNFVQGYFQGFGLYTWPDGAVYEGEWFEDDQQGKGQFKSVDGAVYEGDWIKDQKEGFGKEVYPNGSTYEGEFVNGYQEGKGKYTSVNGDVYDGEFIANKKEGKGVLIKADGAKYGGNWVQDKKQGKGTMTWPNGDVYCGNWLNGKPGGRGKMTYSASKTTYNGEWADGEEVIRASSSRVKW